MTISHCIAQALKLIAVVGVSLAATACVSTTETTADGKANMEIGRDPALVRLVQTCRRLHRHDNLLQAVAICRRAHEVAPEDPVPLVDLGMLYAQIGDHEAAIVAFRGAIARDDGLAEPRIGLGKSLIALQRYDQARVQLEAALATEPNDPRINNAIGVIEDMAGDHVAAQAIYRSGLEQAPNDVALRNNLALSLTLSGADDQAIEILRAIVDSGAANATSRQNLALAHRLKDERQIAAATDDAERAWEELEETGPSDLAAAYAMGEIESIQIMPASGPEMDPSEPGMAQSDAAKQVATADPEPASPSDGAVPALARGAAGQHGFTVQLAAYRSHDKAIAGWQRIEAGGKDLFADVASSITEVDQGAERGVFFRLAVGRFDDKAAAAGFCANLKDREIDCIVTGG